MVVSEPRGRAGRPLAILLLFALIGIACPVSAAERCAPEPGSARAVVKVLDGETLVLDDGSEVRLVGALSPRFPDGANEETSWPPERASKAELERLTLGKSVELGFSGRRTDRYGRMLAQVYVTGGGTSIWVQEQMLRSGHARAYSLPGSAECIEQLIEYERIARRSGIGLWSNAAYQVRAAQRTRDLLRLRSTFQIVEGRVLRVTENKGQIFVNFGSDWHEDFTVRTRRADWKSRPIDWKGLEGRRVQARGWIERRSGPAIELLHPSDLEIETD